MIAPRPCAINRRATSRQPQTQALTLVAQVRFQASAVTRVSGSCQAPAATFT